MVGNILVPLVGGSGALSAPPPPVGEAVGRLTLSPRAGPPIATLGDAREGVMKVLALVRAEVSSFEPEVSSRALAGTLRVVLERPSALCCGRSSTSKKKQGVSNAVGHKGSQRT